jgi:hypothetical protein
MTVQTREGLSFGKSCCLVPAVSHSEIQAQLEPFVDKDQWLQLQFKRPLPEDPSVVPSEDAGILAARACLELPAFHVAASGVLDEADTSRQDDAKKASSTSKLPLPAFDRGPLRNEG